MFSYLRPHKRTSNPTSPNLDSWDDSSPQRVSPPTFENVRNELDFARPRTAVESRRPAGTRMPTPPPPAEASTFDPHKKRLNLLNPMSLLARRRTSQAVPQLAPIPTQEDPRIRGTRVHDFSAPRPRKNISQNDADAREAWSGGHTPVFTEDFEDGNHFFDLPPTRSPPGPPVPPKEIDNPVAAIHPKRTSSIKDIPKPRPRNVSELSTRDLPKPRSRNVSEVSTKDLTGLPRHMKSTSSRFSFDMIGAANQEKLLEDRHRQKALEKQSASPEPEAFEDDYDYDDDGVEERIPGVNADYEEEENYYEEEEIPGQGESGFTFHSLGVLVDPSPIQASIITPRDANGEAIGFAMSKDSPQVFDQAPPEFMDGISKQPAKQESESPLSDGLGLQGVDFGPQKLPHQIDDDDLYFDDGMIDQNDGTEGGEFDESIFDNEDTDEYGRPIRSLSSLPTLYSPPYVQPDKVKAIDSNSQELHSAVSPSFADANPETQEALLQPAASLTKDSLSAYQSALAAAAHDAAANGRFRRDSSPAIPFDERDEFSPEPNSGLDDYENDDFDYDDAMDDDAIIAEANAEALANDCDGFYGQEFGFYSAPAGEAQYANGGFFGPRDIVIRSKSGRNAPREPNLTPITERSEYSNRNSMMNLPLSSHMGGLNNPGLAQLMGDYDEENMSISALLKMRRGWGGSQASLRSSNGSPMSGAGEDAQAHTLWSPVSGLRRNSGFSIGAGSGVGSEYSSAPASPTLTLANMGQLQINTNQTPSPPAALMSSLSSRPLSPTMKGFGMVSDSERDHAFGKQGRSHRHTGSADSISYMKEEDPVQGERWVLERRRTAESGEVEILGREVLGGRI